MTSEKKKGSSSKKSESFSIVLLLERNDVVYYCLVGVLTLSILAVIGTHIFTTSSSTTTTPPAQQAKKISRQSKNTSRLLPSFFEKAALLSTVPTVKPPNDLFDKFDQTKSSSYFSLSQNYRLIPRSDSSGQETLLLFNITAGECANKCKSLGPALCSYFVRDVFPHGYSTIVSNEKYLNKNITFDRTWNNEKSVLHPIQARENEFQFATLEEEAMRIGRKSFACSLRVGVLEPFPDVNREIWVPSWVSENFLEENDIPPFVVLERNTGIYSLVPSQNRYFAKVSSLIAVGLLAGAPHLQQRVFPALGMWLRNEPNVVAFIDRTTAAMQTVRDLLLNATQQRRETVLNPLFACVSTSHLLSLYKFYPEAGGDTFAHPLESEESDWDSELMETIFNKNKKISERHHLFCNPFTPEDDHDGSRVAGINYPVSTSSLFFKSSSNNSQHQRSSTTGFTLFRFIREPHHKTLKQFNGAWKNYIVLYELALFYPTALWYFSVDDDAMVLWKNLRYILLLASISNLHRHGQLYGGYLEYGDNFIFAHGGGGMIISSGTMWNRLHASLPKCMSICRQSYGDVRVGCCMHANEIYERRWSFIWPFVLEKCPERWSNLLVSVHRYQNKREITRIFRGIEFEWWRKMKVVQREFGLNNDSNSNFSFPFPERIKMNFLRNRMSDENQRKVKPANDAIESAVPRSEEYAVSGVLLFDELLFSAEFWRLSKGKRQLRPRVP